MANFLDDILGVPGTKVDSGAPTAPPNETLLASEFNQVTSALLDIQSVVHPLAAKPSGGSNALHILNGAGFSSPIQVVTSSLTLSDSSFVHVDSTSGPITITLPSAAAVASGKVYSIKRIAGNNNVTVVANGLELFDGLIGSRSLSFNGAFLTLLSTNSTTGWRVLSQSDVPASGSYKSVLDYGADPTGNADSSTAFNNALLSGPGTIVHVPAGTYLISNPVFIKYSTILQLLPSAFLNLSAPIRIDEDQAQLIGPYPGGIGFIATVQPTSRAMLKWVGANNSFMVGIMQSFANPNLGLAQSIRGITFDSGTATGMTAMLVGNTIASGGNIPGWVYIEKCAGYNFKFALIARCQQSTFRDIHFHNYIAIPTGSVGLWLGDIANATTTAMFVQRCTIENFATGVQVGNGAVGGVGLLVVRDCVIEGFAEATPQFSGGFGMSIQGFSSGPYYISDNYFESNDDATHANTCIQVGSTAANPGVVYLKRNRLAGFVTSIEGFAWNGLFVTENTFFGVPVTTNAASTRFKNTATGLGGSYKINGIWKDNFMDQLNIPDITGTETVLIRGFKEFERMNTGLVDASATPIPTIYRNTSQLTGSATNTFTIPNATTFILPTPLNGGATIWIANGAFGGVARFWLRGLLGARFVDGPYEDGSVVFTNVANTANKINVYWNGTNYVIQNNLGAGSATTFVIKYEEF